MSQYESLVDRFAKLVRSLHVPKATAEVPFPFQLDPYRATIEHHLPPLIAVGRADRQLLRDERDVIVDHCRTVLRGQGKLLSESEITHLEEYVDSFAPNESQLSAAMKKFQNGAPNDFAVLLKGAEEVITADDEVKDEEKQELAEIKSLFAALPKK
jgi:hypothetical protein